MFERLIKTKLFNMITPTLVIHQHGFTPEKSTYDCIYILLHYIQKALHNKHILPIAFIDFSNAFDIINHIILLHKLKTQFNITNEMYNFIKSFISNRKIRTKYNNQFSDWFNTSAGVPQGTVLGPILFLIYINDFALQLLSISPLLLPLLYADDLAIIPPSLSSLHYHSSSTILQQALNTLSQWSIINKMKINYTKSNIIIYNNSSSSTYLSYIDKHIYTINTNTLSYTIYIYIFRFIYK